MARIEKLVTNGLQVAQSAIQKSGSTLSTAKKPIEAGSEKLTGALNGLASTNSALIKNPLSNIKDLSLLNGEKTKIDIHCLDKARNKQKFQFLFDADNSSVIPLQGHKSGLGVLCPEIPDYPVQEAWYKLRYFLRDLQYNGGKFSEDAKSVLQELGIKEDDIMTRIANNLSKQENFISNLKPSKDDCILYRIMNVQCANDKFKELLYSLNPGEKFIDFAPIHATGDPRYMSQMSEYFPVEKQDIFRIRTPKGSKLVSGKPVEDGITEVIFPSKSVFKFLGRNNFDGMNLWDFAYTLPKS